MDESPAALLRQLDQARQYLLVAYQHARAAGYRPASTEMAALEHAEHRYQHVRSRWQDTYRQDVDPTGQPAGDPDDQPDTVISLPSDEQQIDLDDTRPTPPVGRGPKTVPGR